MRAFDVLYHHHRRTLNPLGRRHWATNPSRTVTLVRRAFVLFDDGPRLSGVSGQLMALCHATMVVCASASGTGLEPGRLGESNPALRRRVAMNRSPSRLQTACVQPAVEPASAYFATPCEGSDSHLRPVRMRDGATRALRAVALRTYRGSRNLMISPRLILAGMVGIEPTRS